MISKIEAIVCEGEGFEPSHIHNHCRDLELKEARQIIMYFAKKETKMTLKAIAGYFNQDHATASHAIKTVGNYIDTDSVFREKIRLYQTKINELKDSFKKIDAVALLFESLERDAELLAQKVIGLQAVLLNIRSEVDKLNKEKLIKNE